tara:strand:- start:3206 stop:3571 length:366 start_codon:yes stop_codon:yes gene_type:complete
MELDNERIILFFNNCGMHIQSLSQLDNLTVSRDVLIDTGKYETLKSDINYFKNKYSTSYFTSLHSNAKIKQKWPLINLIRQILKINGYKFTPKRLCNGYTKEGKKKYKRIFVITKYGNTNC